MTWQNPWAWIGLAAVALPVLIHLLARRAPREVAFPTLRFLGDTRLLPTQRARLTDITLLLVRCAILVAAVAALAQPLFRWRDRQRSVRDVLVRAVIVDTSASMVRASVGGESLARIAERRADTLVAASQSSVVLRTADPAAQLAGAAAWLGEQAGRREIVVLSDFQRLALDSADIAGLPAGIGVKLIAVASETASAQGRDDADLHRAGTLMIRASADENALALAALDAAVAAGAPRLSGRDSAVAIVFPSYARGGAGISDLRALDREWMVRAVARIRGDRTLTAIATNMADRDLAPRDLGPARVPAGATVVARAMSGKPMAVAVAGRVDGREAIVILPMVAPGTMAAAALVAAVSRALHERVPSSELDPAFTPESDLRSWERETGPPSTPSVETGDGISDGRWFWLLALLMIALETVLRRKRSRAGAVMSIEEEARERAA